MKNYSFLSMLLVVLMILSLNPSTIATNESNTNIDNNYQIDIKELSKSGLIPDDHDMGNPGDQGNVYFDPQYFTNAVSYLELKSGSFSNNFADASSTYFYYDLLLNLYDEIPQELFGSFNQFLDDRRVDYNENNLYITQNPLVNKGINNEVYQNIINENNQNMEIDNWALSNSDLVYPLYALVNGGYTINDEYANNIASNYFENSGELSRLYSWAIFLQETGKLTDTIKNQITENLVKFQKTDGQYMGGISAYQHDNEAKLSYGLLAFDLLSKIGVSLNEVFDMNSFYNYFLKYIATANDANRIDNDDGFQKRNKMSLNYTTMFKTYLNNDLDYWSLMHGHNQDTLTNLYAGLALVSILEGQNYTISSYDKDDGIQLAKYHSYNTYWLDENEDNTIDRQPTLQHIGRHGNFATIFSLSKLIEQIDANEDGHWKNNVDSIVKEIQLREYTSGGLTQESWGTGSAYSTLEVIEFLYNLDPDNQSYLSSEMKQKFTDYLKTKIRTQGDSTENGVTFEKTWISDKNNLDDIHSLEQAEYSDCCFDSYNQAYFFEVLKKIGLLTDNQPELKSVYDNLKIYFEGYYTNNPINDYNEYSPGNIARTIERTSVFDIDVDINASAFLLNLENYQTMDGGFSNYQQDLGSSIQTSIPSIAAGFINISNLLEYLKDNIVESDDRAGWGYPDSNNVDTWVTLHVLSPLSYIESDELDSILRDNLDYKKVLKTVNDYMCAGNVGDYEKIFSCNHQIREFSGAIQLLSRAFDTNAFVDFFNDNDKFDMNNIIDYYSALQLKDDQGDYPAGMFANSMDSNGNLNLDAWNVMEPAFRTVKLLEIADSLDKIDLSLLENFLSKMYINENDNYYNGFFKYGIYDTWADVYQMSYGIYLANLSNFTLTVNLEDTFDNQYNYLKQNPEQGSNHIQEFLNWHYQAGLSLEFMYEYVSQDLFQNYIEGRSLKSNGLLTYNTGLDSTVRVAEVLSALGLTDDSKFTDAINYIASCQVTNGYQGDYMFGGFSYSPYDTWGDMYLAGMVMDLLGSSNQLDKIDLNLLFQYLRNRLQQYSYNDQYSNNMYEWVHIGKIVSHFTDRILVEGQMFNYGKPNEDLFRTLSLKDLYGEDIKADSISISLNGSTVAFYTTSPNGGSYNITEITNENGNIVYDIIIAGHYISEGEYQGELKVTAKDYQDLVLSFVLTISDVSFNFDLDRFCCEMIDKWGSFDFGGYITDENNNVFNGPISMDWNLEGPDAQENYDLGWGYDNNNGYINVNLWYDNMDNPDQEPIPGNYTLNVEIILEGMGSIPLSFDFERSEFQGPAPINFEIDYLSEIVQNDDLFKITGSLLDEFGNPFSSVEGTGYYQVWLINSQNENEMISLSDHMGGNWTDVTEDYYYEFSYNSNDGSLVLELHLDDDATITEGTYEFQMEFYIPDMDSYFTFGFRFEREIGEVTDPTDPTNSTSTDTDSTSTDTNSTSTDTNSTSANETQTSQPPAGPEISLPAGLPGFEFISIIALMILSVPIIKKRSV